MFASSARVGEYPIVIARGKFPPVIMNAPLRKNGNFEFYPTTRVVFHRFGLV